MAHNKQITGHLLALLTAVIWGTTFISTKVLLRALAPVEILFFRFLLCYAVLWIARPKFMKPASVRDELQFAGAGLCGVTLYYLLENMALNYTQASNVGVINSSAPIFTALLAQIFLRDEKMTGRFFVGFVVSIVGISLISFNGSFFLNLNPKGDLLAVMSCIAWASYSIQLRKITVKGGSAVATTRRIIFYGLVFMIPPLFFLGFRPDMALVVQPVNLLNLLFLGTCASAVTFVSWNRATGILGAVKASVYIYIVPVITITASVLVLRERITWLSLVGAALAVSGLFISQNRKKAAA